MVDGIVKSLRGAASLPACVFSLMAWAALAGCSHGTIGVVNTNQTLGQQLQGLQANGTLPTLDVSSSLTGTDANGNGVRDDIDTYIAALPDTAVQKKALTQMAQALQMMLTVNTTSASALTAASLANNRAVTCVWSVYTSGQYNKVFTMQEITMDTMVRLKAYELYNAARNGAVVPSLTGSTCN